MTLVPNETEQALNRQYDVYAAAREEYRRKIAEQAAEIERLRAALLTPLTEDEGVWIERRAAELFWQWKRPSGPRVQVIMAQDGIEYWTVKATHEALQAGAALEGRT